MLFMAHRGIHIQGVCPPEHQGKHLPLAAKIPEEHVRTAKEVDCVEAPLAFFSPELAVFRRAL